MKPEDRTERARPTGRGSVRPKTPARPRAPGTKRRPPMVNGTLPAGYGETRVVLLPVDPYLVHVYWEVSERDAIRLKEPVEEGSSRAQAVLRFHDVTYAPIGSLRAAETFDVEIQVEVRNWYVRLLSPEKSYIVDLGLRGKDGRFHRFARSNAAGTPRAWPCKEEATQVMRVDVQDGVLRLDHPVERQRTPETAYVAKASEESPYPPPPREEGKRAVVGLPLVSVTAARVEQKPEARPAPRLSEPAEGAAHEGAGQASERMKPQRSLPVPGNHRETRPVLSQEKSGEVDTRQGQRSGPAGTAEGPKRLSPATGQDKSGSKRSPGRQEGPVSVDLSLWCEHLFVSGISSAYSPGAGEGEGQD